MTSKTTKIILISAWGLFVVALLLIAFIFSAIAKGSIGYMPKVEQLENPIDKYASQIVSADGKVLGVYAHSMENRIHVNYEDLSPDLVKALIATEDIRFARHSGIDATGLFRAFVKRGILMQKSGGGGSTITQQLAKQLYSPNAENVLERVLQKPIEWVIAVQLERFYTKEEIINMYLNKFDFLYNAVGIQSAARVYFGKTPQTLKIEESATLIGMCKNPSYYNPVRQNERTRGRRNVVLEQMYKADYLSRTDCDSLKALPLTLYFTRMDHKEGLAPYYREHLRMVLTAKKPDKKNYRGWQMQKFKEDSVAWETDPLYGWCNKNKKADGSNYNIYTDGLKIYSTIDSRMQQYAEEAVKEHIGGHLQNEFFKEKKGRSYAPFSRDLRAGQVDTIMIRAMQQSDRYRGLKGSGMKEEDIRKDFQTPVDMRVFSWAGPVDTVMAPIDSIRYHKSFLRTAFMSMDARTGHVKAYVGGIDYNYFQYDMVNGGRRQVGSTIKPYLYSLAMLEGISPCEQMLHVEQTLRDENGIAWTPKNSSPKNVGERVTIKWGLQNSSNWVTAYLMSRLSPYTFVRLLHSFGLQNEMDPVVSICLGTPDVSVGEMVTGYSVFANRGLRVDPVYVTQIEDSYGNTVATFTPKMDDILTEDAAFKMLYMLRSVINGGTGGRIRARYGIQADMGGKTGTTQNHSDGWFMAFTPSLVGGCWVGGEDRSIRFDRMTEGQGASMALPIYGLFMQKVYADKTLGYSEDEKFDIPEEYIDPCNHTEVANPENRVTSPDLGGIDRMFE
ncbi:transglycosylase domain-containing protein [Parabacteroides sp. PF5-6]|uniref:transglycosylase domain-containing protein n=1 Tax=Parabacteroides sp. PF5-6 TaxID=1742403 RepID=UPI002404A69B|nr:transglycosylase domain-containing protein [Parabacteroides sp. PF5-6]MDF9831645.1 penicillin-binding protein 1A [Parabacteroides sp. PF5-6]